MSTVKVGQTWRRDLAWPFVVRLLAKSAPPAWGWRCEVVASDHPGWPVGTVDGGFSGFGERGWTLISDAPAAAVVPRAGMQVTYGPAKARYTFTRVTESTVYVDFETGETDYSLKQVQKFLDDGVWVPVPAVPPVAERPPAPQHRDCDDCGSPVALMRRTRKCRRPIPYCDVCWGNREAELSQFTADYRPTREPLDLSWQGTWRAPDLLARPWLYRGRGR